MAKATNHEAWVADKTTDDLKWRLEIQLPHEITTTNHARRLASLRRQERAIRAELARRVSA